MTSKGTNGFMRRNYKPWKRAALADRRYGRCGNPECGKPVGSKTRFTVCKSCGTNQAEGRCG